MIEIAFAEYWKVLTLNEAVMYCFSLNIDGKIGWRFPIYKEVSDTMDDIGITGWWHAADREDDYWEHEKFMIVPVRDIKDD
jgi:hypothetical protein